MSIGSSNRVVLCLLLALAGCNSTPGKDFFTETIDSLHAKNSPLRAGYTGPSTVTSAASAGQRFNGAQYQGSGQFVSSSAPVTQVTTDGSGQYELNLVNAPIAEAAKAVLGDALHLNYIVDPRVQGTVTLQTSQPVSKDALVDILESALAVNGAGITKRAGTYQIVPLSEIMSNTPPVSVPSVSPSGPGVKVQVLQLQYIAADEMKTILEPITRQGSVLRVDSTRNLITVAGNDSDLNAIREAVSVFDVDWMRGMSVALHPLKTSKPEAVAAELDSIFGTKEGPGAKLIQFIPNDRLNSVLVITSRPAYLARAATWINKLDKTGRDQRGPALRLPDPEPPGQGTGRGAELGSRHLGQDRGRHRRLERVARPDADRHAVGRHHPGAVDRAVAFDAAAGRTAARRTPPSSPTSKTMRC